MVVVAQDRREGSFHDDISAVRSDVQNVLLGNRLCRAKHHSDSFQLKHHSGSFNK